jgi:hypothetical protein
VIQEPKETLEQKVMLVQTDQMVPEDPLVQMEQQELKVTLVLKVTQEQPELLELQVQRETKVTQVMLDQED